MREENASLPPRDYRVSRALRVGVFSFVASSLIVAGFVVTFQWIWNGFLGDWLHNLAPNVIRGGDYEARLEVIALAILFLTGLIAYWLWDASSRLGGRESQR